MNIAQLQYFLAVYDSGSYTTAAESMYTSRQTLGRAVSELEKEIGHELFTRKGRGIEPTPVGMEAADIARTIVANAHRLTSFANEVIGDQKPEPFTLALAHNEHRGAAINPAALRAHLQKHRFGHVNILPLPSESCLVSVIRGLADATIVIGRADYPEYENEFVGRKPALVAMGQDNLLARKKTLMASDLKTAEIAIPDNMSFFFPRVNAVCEASGFTPKWACVSGNVQAQRNFLVRGGLMFVHEDAPVLQSTPGLCVVPLDDATKLNYPIFFVSGKEKRNPQTLPLMHVIMGLLE